MDDLIETFFKNNFTEELQTQLFKSLGLFTVYGLTNVHADLTDIIMEEQDDHREVIVDKVHNRITEGLDYLFSIQRIRLEETAPLGYKTGLLEALFAFSYREDYMPFQIVTEDWTLNNEEKLAAIIADIQGTDVTEVLEHLDWVYDGTIDKLKEFIGSRIQEENTTENMDLLRTIRRNLKAYEAAFGTPASVKGLVDINMSMGSPFQIYLDLFRESVFNLGDLESTTYNLMWLAMVSCDGTENPQKLLLEQAEELFPDLHQLQIFSSMLQKAMGRYQDYRKHQK